MDSNVVKPDQKSLKATINKISEQGRHIWLWDKEGKKYQVVSEANFITKIINLTRVSMGAEQISWD